MDFEPFQKIARLTRECTITEKIDGTNACVVIGEDGEFRTGSRSRWITPDDDNFGFARWAYTHRDELMQLGPGRHFGEWWGSGIQRGYGLKEKRFSLFNAGKWGVTDPAPPCCYVVPVIATGMFSTELAAAALATLQQNGSIASPGFARPEGIIVYHHALRCYMKKTLEKDEEFKGKSERGAA